MRHPDIVLFINSLPKQTPAIFLRVPKTFSRSIRPQADVCSTWNQPGTSMVAVSLSVCSGVFIIGVSKPSGRRKQPVSAAL